ncbi:bifunctional lytic transglycosylase/C40 family peptidase [Lentzea sp. BCCO 10_0798]|uniref:Bifunctional lytic transglycosylase/C40 family peptidase n=1 Tax=Lentzea kristufekii TaxID=3095430 RepID=A0ABU4TZM8_9PSEU|nr:bifunctional lytic transglycosylase/C40 family peptidase [Lentzea sp. BCCO 10_0798]MDX8053768.1 bifunctional lytic transglycosylase/C40 family peptidase [Lentzea sp. BCCO 10_0798]
MIVKVGAAVMAAILVISMLIVGGVSGAISALLGGGGRPSATALADIPADYLALYRAAAGVCPGLDWSILAAIGKIETDHGRSTLPGVHSGENVAGAAGVMQFLAPTFASVTSRHIIPPGGRTPPSRYDPHDAIHAAAFYLCDSGARDGTDLYRAIFTYNRADWYVRKVLDQAALYTQAASDAAGACAASQSAGDLAGAPAAVVAVRFACGELGEPYVWGGDGPAEGGWDCSGLTKAAYAAAGIKLERVAQDQYDMGPLVPAGSPLQAGDLVYYGTGTASVTHVGIAISPTHMVNAPEPGTTVRIDKIGRPLAATRPVSGGSRG